MVTESLAEMFVELRSSFDQISELEKKLVSAEKENSKVKIEFINLLLGEKFFGNETFMRMYSIKCKGKQVLKLSMSELSIYDIYAEFSSAQAVQFDISPYDRKDPMRIVIMRPKDSDKVELYRVHYEASSFEGSKEIPAKQEVKIAGDISAVCDTNVFFGVRKSTYSELCEMDNFSRFYRSLRSMTERVLSAYATLISTDNCELCNYSDQTTELQNNIKKMKAVADK